MSDLLAAFKGSIVGFNPLIFELLKRLIAMDTASGFCTAAGLSRLVSVAFRGAFPSRAPGLCNSEYNSVAVDSVTFRLFLRQLTNRCLSLAPFQAAFNITKFIMLRKGRAFRASESLGRNFCSAQRIQRLVKAADIASCASFEEAGLRGKKTLKRSINMGCNEAWFDVNIERSGRKDQPDEPESCTAEPCGGP